MKKSKKRRRLKAGQVKSAPRPEAQRPTMPGCRFGSVDWSICAGLLLFLAFQTATTWRKWPDLLIDYGRELYVPWQITKGAILYKDILHYYGPLGVSLNAGLFRVFGVGFDTLFISSLVMLAGFTLGIYVLLKRMTDRLAAGLAVFLFLCAFAFGNYVGIGNYNFVSPYSHDTVYGLYLCVGMLAALWAYLSSGKLRWMIPAGLAFGCAYLTKPEITVAAVAVSGLAFLASVWLALKPPIESQSQLEGRPPCRPWIPTDRPVPPNARSFDPGCIFLPWLVFLACAVIPVLAFNLWFIAHIPGSAGWLSIHNSWVAIFGTKIIRESLTNLTFMGFDNPRENLVRLIKPSIYGIVAIAILAVLGWVAGRYRKSAPIPALMAAVALLGFTAWLLVTAGKDFLQIGHILVLTSGLLLIFRVTCFVRLDGSRCERAHLAARALWSALGAALLLKMLLNPRIEHYGFFQAMPATLDLAMFMLFDMPRLQRRFGGAEQLSRIAGSLIVATVAVGLCVRAHTLWDLKTFSVAGGRDTIRTYSENVNPMGAIVETLRTQILLHHSDAKTLMVFPDSVSLNYLFRLKDPSPLFEFVPPALAFYGQDRLIGDLDRSPPDLIVLISRDLREFGSPVFGYDEVSGRRLIEWMQTRYHVAIQIGGNPLQPNQAGVILLERNRSSTL
jgi:hypothetical protein